MASLLVFWLIAAPASVPERPARRLTIAKLLWPVIGAISRGVHPACASI
jgi:hypothetical protein